MNKKSKNKWKEHMVGGVIGLILIIWAVLIRGGYDVLPGAKRLSEIIPMWIVILNLAFLLILITLLIDEKNFIPIRVPIRFGVFFIGSVISWNFYVIGLVRFPLVSLIGIALAVFIAKKFVDTNGFKKKRKKIKKIFKKQKPADG